jgi:predicted metal-dependent hydrolase
VLVVRCPYGTKKERILEFVNSHTKWIESKQKIVKNRIVPIDKLSKNEILELKKLAKEYIPPRVMYYSSLLGVTPTKISINQAKTRFGSCSSKKSLNFSCNVMRYPNEAIDYVILHEVAHIIELNHSKRFWAIIEQFMPDYKERKQILKTR